MPNTAVTLVAYEVAKQQCAKWVAVLISEKLRPRPLPIYIGDKDSKHTFRPDLVRFGHHQYNSLIGKVHAITFNSFHPDHLCLYLVDAEGEKPITSDQDIIDEFKWRFLADFFGLKAVRIRVEVRGVVEANQMQHAHLRMDASELQRTNEELAQDNADLTAKRESTIQEVADRNKELGSVDAELMLKKSEYDQISNDLEDKRALRDFMEVDIMKKSGLQDQVRLLEHQKSEQDALLKALPLLRLENQKAIARRSFLEGEIAKLAVKRAPDQQPLNNGVWLAFFLGMPAGVSLVIGLALFRII